MPDARSNRDAWFKFFPNDWRSDEQLQACTISARGLWIELMCLAHKEHGYVRVNGKPVTPTAIARQVRLPPAKVRSLLRELLTKGVCSALADGTLYSRRMVRDAKRREICRQNGSHGGNSVLLSGSNRVKSASLSNLGVLQLKPETSASSQNGISNLDKTQIQKLDPDLERSPPTPPSGGG